MTRIHWIMFVFINIKGHRFCFLQSLFVTFVVVGTYHYNHGIAVDVVSQLVYYMGRLYEDYAEEKFWTGFIAATTLEGHHHFLLITIPTYVPRDIVLDHIRG